MKKCLLFILSFVLGMLSCTLLFFKLWPQVTKSNDVHVPKYINLSSMNILDVYYMHRGRKLIEAKGDLLDFPKAKYGATGISGEFLGWRKI